MLCQQQVLNLYLDRQPQAGCVASKVLCDQCQPIQIEDVIARMQEWEIVVDSYGAD